MALISIFLRPMVAYRGANARGYRHSFATEVNGVSELGQYWSIATAEPKTHTIDAPQVVVR